MIHGVLKIYLPCCG